MWYRRGTLLFSNGIHQISRSYRIKYRQLRPELSVSRLQLSLNSPMDLKWCTKLDVVQKCPIVFQGHPSNFTVIQDKTWAEKSSNWIQFEITRASAAIKSLRFALFRMISQFSNVNIHFYCFPYLRAWIQPECTRNVEIVKRKEKMNYRNLLLWV